MLPPTASDRAADSNHLWRQGAAWHQDTPSAVGQTSCQPAISCRAPGASAEETHLLRTGAEHNQTVRRRACLRMLPPTRAIHSAAFQAGAYLRIPLSWITGLQCGMEVVERPPPL